jgi:hypothetical protein
MNLFSTAAKIESTTSFLENLQTRINMFIPKSLDRSLTDAAHNLFADHWLDQPDDVTLPTSSTPLCVMPPSGQYKLYATNYERFAANELTKRLDTESFTKKGFILQAIAAGWHHKSKEQLKELGDQVGRERIMILHSKADNMMPVSHGRKLIEMIQPGVGIIRERTGHVFMIEEQAYHDSMIEAQIAKAANLKK